jgi:hypothetical protein
VDIWPIQKAYQKQLTSEFLVKFSLQLGVSVSSLQRLEAGWDGKHYTFPMRNANEWIIGISVRGKDKKWCVTGSSNGLFWPWGLDLDSDKELWFPEGPTDCGALLDMCFDAIGRQGCLGCTDHIITLLKRTRRKKRIVIMADKDTPKTRPDGSQWVPGLEGAERLAKAISKYSESIKIIQPPYCKDIRQWRNKGATREMVLAVLNNTRFF